MHPVQLCVPSQMMTGGCLFSHDTFEINFIVTKVFSMEYQATLERYA